MTQPMQAPESVISRVGASWANAFRDIVRIVASIVMAFALDAWWDARSAGQRADQRAGGLTAEFERIQERLRGERAEVLMAAAARRTILNSMGPVAPVVSAESLADLFVQSFAIVVSRPEGGALLAML